MPVCAKFDCVVCEIIYSSHFTTAAGKISDVSWWSPVLCFAEVLKLDTNELSYSGSRLLIGTWGIGCRTC